MEDWNNLPVELYVEIFSFLKLFEIKTATLVCHNWKNIVHKNVYPKICRIQNKYFDFVHNKLIFGSEMMKYLTEHCDIRYRFADIRLGIDIDAAIFVPFFNKFGPHFEYLELTMANGIKKEHRPIFSNFENLKYLQMHIYVDEGLDRHNLQIILPELQSLEGFKIECIDKLNVLYIATKKLERCAFQNFVAKPFYLNFIAEHQDTLTDLSFSLTKQGVGRDFFRFLNSLRFLRLEKFFIGGYYPESDYRPELYMLLQKNLEMTHLSIRIKPYLEANHVKFICTVLTNLKHLEIMLADMMGSQLLKCLKNLEVLKMSTKFKKNWKKIDPIPNIKALSVTITREEYATLNFDNILMSFHNLTRLEITETTSSFRDAPKELPKILRHLIHLQHIQMLKWPIKDDCMRDEVILALNKCAELRTVEIFFYNLTDGGLCIINWPKVKTLKLGIWSFVYPEGMRRLAASSPYIEELELSYNTLGLNDECLEIITSKLKYLRALRVTELHHLTEATVESIVKNCKYLEMLEVWNCRFLYRVREIVGSRMPNLKSLRDS